MAQTIKSSWQIWLIAVALMIVIPATVQLGLRVFIPKDNWEENSLNMRAFNDTYDKKHGGAKKFDKIKNKDAQEELEELEEQEEGYYKQRNEAWKQTEDFKKNEYIVCKRFIMGVIVGGCATALLFAFSGIISVPVISASLIVSGLIIYGFNNLGTTCPIWYDMNVNILHILFALMSLIIVLRLAYRDSKEI